MQDAAPHTLKRLRLSLGYTLQDVAAQSQQIAKSKANNAYIITPSRLSEIESKGVLPSFFRLYTLAKIYRSNLAQLLHLYGVELNTDIVDLSVAPPGNTFLLELPSSAIQTQAPPLLDTEVTQQLPASFVQWGIASLANLRHAEGRAFSYGYVGTRDKTMAPLIPPGSVIQIDKTKTAIRPGPYFSEYERPIYWIETRVGYVCSWCVTAGNHIQLIPHQHSGVAPRALRHPQEAEVVGQVVGVAALR